MKSTTSVTVDVDLKQAAEKEFLNVSQCTEFGIRFALAERASSKEKRLVIENYPKNSLLVRIDQLIIQLNGGIEEDSEQDVPERSNLREEVSK